MYIDLGDLQSGWHTLPDYPHPVPEILCECKMAVYANKAYLFAGFNTLDVFDLVSEQWSTLETVFPVNRRERRNGGGANMLQLGSGYAMEIVDGKMYVFGGRSSDAPNGCSLFVVLDIESCTWRKLSGGVPGTPEWTAPGPRKYALMWTDTQHERLMLMYGDADRDSDKDGELIESYAYDDMWSWDIRGEAWHRERICGNAPSTRMEAGVTFVSNPVFSRLVRYSKLLCCCWRRIQLLRRPSCLADIARLFPRTLPKGKPCTRSPTTVTHSCSRTHPMGGGGGTSLRAGSPHTVRSHVCFQIPNPGAHSSLVDTPIRTLFVMASGLLCAHLGTCGS